MKKLFPSIFIASAVFLAICGGALAGKELVRPACVAGAFYASTANLIGYQVDNFFTKARPSRNAAKTPRLLIVPHAGYVYSGQTASYAYVQLEGWHFDTVVLVGPYHKELFPGVSVWTNGNWQTPLGEVPIDEAMARQISDADASFHYNSSIHLTEHSLEVQLPFLQKTLKNFKIVPILLNDVSEQNTSKLAAAVAKAVKGKNALVVVSTDMSHYYQDITARQMDRLSLGFLESKDEASLRGALTAKKSEFCGAAAVLTALELLKIWNSPAPELLNYSNTSDITGDKASVVGYSALAVYTGEAKPSEAPKQKEVLKPKETLKEIPKEKVLPAVKEAVKEPVKPIPAPPAVAPKEAPKPAEAPKPPAPAVAAAPSSVRDDSDFFTKAQERFLLGAARLTLETYLKDRSFPELKSPDSFLSENAAVFVTLNEKGHLRGCVGSMAAEEPLYLAVQHKAAQAATEDPRFRPVTPEELKDIRLEISVLSFPKLIKDPAQIVMGRHGVIVKQGPHIGLFLPEVAKETGWSRERFLNELCSQKAGLPADAWKDPRTELYVFTTRSFAEEEK